jgi:hypothetical protein
VSNERRSFTDGTEHVPMNLSQEQISNATSGGVFGFFILVLIIGGNWLWGKINNWDNLDFPLNLVGAFYYYTAVLPIKSVGYVWGWLGENGLTGFDNLDFVLQLVLSGLYAYGLLGLWGACFIGLQARLNRNNKGQPIKLLPLYLLPATLTLLLSVAIFVLGWLFA